MSYSPGIGLVLGLGLDPSGVKPGVEDFDKLMDDATQQWNESWEKTTASVDEGILSNRESVRLLGEEFGIHMPRAVSSALAKMLPDIASLGGALLGIYAAKELYDGIGKFTDWVRSSFTEQTADAEAFAKAAAAAYETAGKAAESAFTKFKTVAAGAFQIADIDAHAAHLVKIADAYHQLAEKAGGDIRVLGTINAEAVQTIADASKAGISSMEEADQKLKEAAQLQFQARQHMAEVSKKAEEELTREHERQAHEWVEGEKQKTAASKRSAEAASREAEAWAALMVRAAAEDDRLLKRMQQWHEEWLKALGMPEEAKFSLQEIIRNIDSAGRAAAASLPSLDALGGGFHQLSEAEREALPLSGKIDDALMKQAQRIRDVVSEIEQGELPARRRIEAEYQKQVDAANRELAAKREEYAQGKILRAQMEADEAAYTQLMVDLAKQRQKAEHDESQARREEVESEAAGLGEAVAGLVKSKKMQAEVEGAFDVAKSIECMAKFIDSGGTDAAALLASVKYGVSAAEFFKVAGKSGGSTDAGSGGAGGDYGTRGGGSGDYGREDRGGWMGAGDQFVSGSGLAPGAQGSTGGRLNVIVIGEAEQARFFADGVNSADQAGHFMQVSSARRSAVAQG
jgi:hypothetical protein